MPPAALLTLNVDLGELPDEPDELYALADQVNLACGGHAGDHASLERACRLALAAGARIVAHPSYPDREHFGRRSLTITTDELARSVRAQCTALATVAARLGIEVDAVKPHGALYHDAARRPELASALARACREGPTWARPGPPSLRRSRRPPARPTPLLRRRSRRPQARPTPHLRRRSPKPLSFTSSKASPTAPTSPTARSARARPPAPC
ncbi:MAG: LamB/YcsF family protein [Polyangiaceae bacterium]|nr:LamB/YcsF family protein [Polyangiaceae bacterium]